MDFYLHIKTPIHVILNRTISDMLCCYLKTPVRFLIAVYTRVVEWYCVRYCTNGNTCRHIVWNCLLFLKKEKLVR